jgi:hypothetical protein
MLLAAAVAALAVMLIGGAGPAAAQTSPTSLAKTVKLTGTAKKRQEVQRHLHDQALHVQAEPR